MKTPFILLLLFVSRVSYAQLSLSFSLGTGADDLRGGNDNVNIIILLNSGNPIRFDNINGGRRLPNSTLFGANRDLPANVSLDNIRAIQIEGTMQGGIAGDNWNLNEFKVYVNRDPTRMLVNERGTPLMRFTGSNRVKTFALISNRPPPAQQVLMLDADFSRPEIPLGPLDRPTPPAFVEPQDYPGKPIPGTIRGDLYSFWSGNRAEFVVATDPAITTANRFLRLPHLPVLSMLNLISQAFSATTNTQRQIQARLVFVARDLMPDDVTFILNDPAEIFANGGLSDGIPNGLVRLKLQNGQIWVKTEGPDSPQIRVGAFRSNVRTEVAVKLLLRPNATVEVTVNDGMSSTVNRSARTPGRSFLPIDQVGRLAWHIMPPVYQQRPAQLQEFRLLGAYIQTY